MTCPGSVKLSEGIADAGSTFAAEGTAAHWAAEQLLLGKHDQLSVVGQKADNGITVTRDMVVEVMKYVAYVQDLVASTGGTLLVEQRLPISSITGEADAHGTSDVVILAGDELIVVDLKFGMGVPVSAENNPQLQIYALAAVRQFEMLADFQRVRAVAHQPRLNSVSEWSQSVDDLVAFGDKVWNAAIDTRQPDAKLVPSEKGCKFCRAKAKCPALQAQVMDAFDNVKPESADLQRLGWAMGMVSLVETWCKAIRGAVETELLAGKAVEGYKLVKGKQGNRKWADSTEAEALLKSMRLKVEEMYDLSLISPTTAEKLVAAEVIGPRQWKRVLPLITRSEGQPSVAPVSDKRPAIEPISSDDFDVVQPVSEFV